MMAVTEPLTAAAGAGAGAEAGTGPRQKLRGYSRGLFGDSEPPHMCSGAIDLDFFYHIL